MDNTQTKVLTAARQVFRKKGFSGARMGEIADTAGVNKALLNYYYRSKEKMFQQVLEEDLGQFIHSVFEMLNSDLPLDMKIYKVVDMYTSMLLRNPDLPLFILSSVRENPDRLMHLFAGGRRDLFANLKGQLKEEHEKGNIKKTSVPMFLSNLLSLTVFPFVMQPMLERMFELSEDDFADFVRQRKKIIPRMIIDSLIAT